jgi:hypothetical protein
MYFRTSCLSIYLSLQYQQDESDALILIVLGRGLERKMLGSWGAAVGRGSVLILPALIMGCMGVSLHTTPQAPMVL